MRFGRIVAQAERDALFVLPACVDPAKKHPAIEWKHLQDRRPTDAEITEWLERYPRRNGVYLTGPVLGRFILDCDGREATEWVRNQGVPTTQVVRTRKGYHIHFKYPEFRVFNPVGAIHPGVDVRGFGGVAVAVGSIHQSGFRYSWARGRAPQDVPLSAAPEWLRTWLREYATRRESIFHLKPRPFSGEASNWARRAINAELEQLTVTPKGSRNAALARAAYKLGQLVGGGEADANEIRAALYAIAQSWPENEKSESTIDRCIEAGVSQPRYRKAR